MAVDTNPTDEIRRVLTDDEFQRIITAIRDATDTRQLLGAAMGALYNALLADTGRTLDQASEGARVRPGDYAIPTSQWQAILAAATGRAQAWGTAAEVGLELALGLMPAHYDDPQAPVPDLALPDYRPSEHTITLSREAVDVIGDCEAHLGRLHTFYGAGSAIYQDALNSWHRNLTALITMNTGAHTRVSKDGTLSLFVRTSSGLVYALVFHGDTRRCTSPDCEALIDDDGTARPGRPAADPDDDRRRCHFVRIQHRYPDETPPCRIAVWTSPRLDRALRDTA
jgi:hypothetical protein